MNFKRFLTAVKQTILAAAIFHLVLLAVYAFWSRDFSYVNIVNILDLQLYFKNLDLTPGIGIWGLLVPLVLIFWNYKNPAKAQVKA